MGPQIYSATSSWVPIPPRSHFSLANIPFGIISTKSDPTRRPAIAIGSEVLDLREFTLRHGFAPLFARLSVAEREKLTEAFTKPGRCETLNAFAALGRPCHRLVRVYLQKVLSVDGIPVLDDSASVTTSTTTTTTTMPTSASLNRAMSSDRRKDKGKDRADIPGGVDRPSTKPRKEDSSSTLVSSTGSGPAAVLRDDPVFRAHALLPQTVVDMHLPMKIGDYTDFYAGINHAINVGALFRGHGAALQPNYRHLPVGYHGRASSVTVSGTKIRRPVGQIVLPPPPPVSSSMQSSTSRPGDNDRPRTAIPANAPTPTTTTRPKPCLSPTQKLDFELELGAFICRSREMGDRPVTVDEASAEYLFGLVLLNDWSARDVQAWEYVPLGPFTAKNFATSVSAWVVLMDALEPFAVMAASLDNDDGNELLAYLRPSEPKRDRSLIDIHLEVKLTTESGNRATITRTSSRHLLYSFAQMVAHHTVTGCNIQTGDLVGSGTISGPSDGEASEWGSLLEQNRNGSEKLVIIPPSQAQAYAQAQAHAHAPAYARPHGASVSSSVGDKATSFDGVETASKAEKGKTSGATTNHHHHHHHRNHSHNDGGGNGNDIKAGKKEKQQQQQQQQQPQIETRMFLEDGDTIALTGVCRPVVDKDGDSVDGSYSFVGFGTCSGTIMPAWPVSDGRVVR